MSEYFKRVAQDYATIGLLAPATTPGEDASTIAHNVYDWYDLYYLVQATEGIGAKDPAVYKDIDLPGRTSAGKSALELCQAGVSFIGGNGQHYCCHTAELRLLASIDPRAVRRPDFRSPLILVDGAEPVGVIKSRGEPTCYSLVTDLNRGLIAGSFSTPVLRVEHEQLLRAPHAWVINIEAFYRFLPLRFSRFALPVAERMQLKARTTPDHLEFLVTSHNIIVDRVRQLLRYAEEFKLFDSEDSDMPQQG